MTDIEQFHQIKKNIQDINRNISESLNLAISMKDLLTSLCNE